MAKHYFTSPILYCLQVGLLPINLTLIEPAIISHLMVLPEITQKLVLSSFSSNLSKLLHISSNSVSVSYELHTFVYHNVSQHVHSKVHTQKASSTTVRGRGCFHKLLRNQYLSIPLTHPQWTCDTWHSQTFTLPRKPPTLRLEK